MLTEQKWYGESDKDGHPLMYGSHGVKPVAWYILLLRLGREPAGFGLVCRNNACINPDHIEEITPELKAIDDIQFGYIGDQENA